MVVGAQHTDHPGVVSARPNITLRRILGRPDPYSTQRFLLVLIGLPLLAFPIRAALMGFGFDAVGARHLGNGAALLATALAVYFVARQRQLILEDRARLADRLSRMTSHFRTIAENSTDIVYIAGADRRTTWISPSITKLLGWEMDEVLGRSMASFMHPDDQASTEEIRERIYSGQPVEPPPGGFVMRFRAKSGGYRWMAINTRQVLDDSGMLTNVVGGLTLVEDLVQARHRAEANERLLQLISDAMLDPQVLLLAVRDGAGEVVDFAYAHANQAACDYLQLSRDELIGTRFLRSEPGFSDRHLLNLCAEALATDTPIAIDDFRHHNELLDVDSHFDIRARRVDDERLAVTWRDVGAARETSRRLAESEIRFRLLAENSLDVIMLSDLEMNLNWVSPSSLPVLGWEPEELIGNCADEYIHPADRPAVSETIASSTASGEQVRVHYRWRRPDGSYRWVESVCKPVPDDGTGKRGRVSEIRDIDAQVKVQEQLKYRATFDDLTGVLQREGAFDRLAAIEARTQDAGVSTGVLFIDIDDFKPVNDQRGHATGDAVLRAVADRARAAVRGADVVARMGGDEFLVILEGVGSLDRALSVANKINAACALPIATPTGETFSTVSIGVTLIGPGETADDTIARADAAMYAAKARGRNQVVAIPLV